jgi:hypothetical protein
MSETSSIKCRSCSVGKNHDMYMLWEGATVISEAAAIA